jgi:hypothetical protein
VAEQLIGSLCEDAFFADFCFLNPLKKTGKELCDVLVVLDSKAIVWQIKNLTKKADGSFDQSEIEKAIKQCRGAKRRLKTLGTLKLTNVNGKEKQIDTSKISEVHMIAAIEGGVEDIAGFFDDDSKRGNVHIFYDAFTRFATKYLNTVTDFIEYLNKKEQFLQDKELIISGGEENLLALYLKNARTFGELETSGANMIFLDDENIADSFEKMDGLKRKLKADEWSKGWDELIAKKREALAIDDKEDSDIAKDKFLSKMMSHNRLERRLLGRVYFEAAVTAHELDPKVGNIGRRIVPTEDGVTYVFLFYGDDSTPIDELRKLLHLTTMAARQAIPKNDMVIGIGTKQHMVASRSVGFEWVLVDVPFDEFQKDVGKDVYEFREKTGTWMNPEVSGTSTDEYPADPKSKD